MINPLRVLLFSSVLVVGLSFPCWADQIQGFVEAVDPSDNSILVKDPVSGTGKSVRVHPKVIAEVKKGSVVKAIFQPGSDQADTFEVLVVRP